MSLSTLVHPDPKTWLEQFKFYIPVRVRFAETDALGHVNNAVYFVYYEQARLDYFTHLGVGQILNDPVEQKSVVTADMQCHFIKEIRYPDQLKVHARIARIGRSSMEFEYAITRDDGRDQESLCAAGRGALVYIDLHHRKSTPIPDHFKQKIIAFEKMEG